ncbi:hypothetical protein ACKFKF_32365 [Phormidesmis sp. 146-12]
MRRIQKDISIEYRMAGSDRLSILKNLRLSRLSYTTFDLDLFDLDLSEKLNETKLVTMCCQRESELHAQDYVNLQSPEFSF